MASTYTTVSGDTWDLIAWKKYGDEKYMRELIQANLPLAEVLRFDAGTEIVLPDIERDTPDDLPFWHSGNDNSLWAEDAV